MRIFSFDLIEELSQKDPQPDGDDEENENFQTYQPPRRVFPPFGQKGRSACASSALRGEARKNGKDDDADDVVDDRRRDDGGAHFRIEFPKLFERGDRDGNGSGGQDCPVEEMT